MNKKSEVKYGIRKGNQFLDSSDIFRSPSLFHKDTVIFDSEDLALDKAESLGLHLDSIDVVRKHVGGEKSKLPRTA